MKTQLLNFVRSSVMVVLLAVPNLCAAQDILSIEASGKSESFSFEELLAMPQSTVVTNNDYLDHATTFTGPSLREILERYDVSRDATLTMTALNDFASKIPASDAFDYDVILALLLDGEPMSIREKGPIWVIYPMDDNVELQDDVYNGRLVWQLKNITVE